MQSGRLEAVATDVLAKLLWSKLVAREIFFTVGRHLGSVSLHLVPCIARAEISLYNLLKVDISKVYQLLFHDIPYQYHASEHT